MLERLGYTADAVADGLEALEAVGRREYDLILMDVQMPLMDGLEATKEIRKRFQAQAIHIVALTATAMLGDREKCLEAGMDDYVPKPLRLEDLKAALKRYPAHQGEPSAS